MASQKGIGRLVSYGYAKETTRGTAISSAAAWSPWDSLDFDEKFDNVVADQAVGVIEDNIAEYRVKNYADGSFKMPLTDQSSALLLLSMMGGQSVSTPATGVYAHKFTVGETAQHQSLTMFVHDPLGGTDFSHANGVIHKMDIDVQLKKFVQLSLSVRAQKGVSQSAFTPSIIAENRFIPQYMTFATAPSLAGAAGTLTATGTASTTTALTGLSISTTLLRIGMTVTGTNVAVGTTITAIVSASAVTLSTATTGSATSFTFGGAVIALKNFKLSLDASIEDQEVLGSVAPADYLNKEFKVSGTLEAIYQNLTDFKNLSMATPYVAQAMQVTLVNTDVTIGTASNPTLTIQLDQCNFKDLGIKKDPKGVVYQSLKFSASYSLANSEMINMSLQNTTSGTY
jgi:hypothetical protein